ncbi:protein NIM1-INTERACTING 3 [Malania oleifera]|uniref:protein NIM1-INTERACTING 3 n=1 Tax=Malania oleifera TaxID=397392 RepID=UPI0025AE4EEE|nr:protein NIM1-INTERACTING 3 [Malania oleifera]
MEGETKRRTMVGEEDEDEEEKIEKFFAIIRNTREVQQRLVGSRPKEDEKEEAKEEKPSGGKWNPTFQLEDFAEDALSKGSSSKGAGPSRREENKEGEGGGDGLDLKLSL